MKKNRSGGSTNWHESAIESVVCRHIDMVSNGPKIRNSLKKLLLPLVHKFRFASINRTTTNSSFENVILSKKYLVFVITHEGAARKCFDQLFNCMNNLSFDSEIVIIANYKLHEYAKQFERNGFKSLLVPELSFKELLFCLGPNFYRKYSKARLKKYKSFISHKLRFQQNVIIFNHSDFTLLGCASILVAHERNYKEVTLQHGILSDEFVPTITSEYWTWNEESGKRLKGNSVRRLRTKALGASFTDPYFNLTDNQKEKIRIESRQKLGWPSNHLAILYVSNSNSKIVPKSTHKRVSKLIEEIELSGEINFYRRFHPDEISKPMKMFNLNREIQEMPIVDLLLSVDVVLGIASTVLAESIALGTPAFQIFPEGYSDPRFPVLTEGATLRKSKDVTERIKLSIQGEVGKTFSKKQRNLLFSNQGHATKIVFDSIMSL